MTITVPITKQENKKRKEIFQKQEVITLLSLDDPADDDLHKIYFVESEKINGKFHKIIATVFGATSCSCIEQTKNPYQSCKHMEILDQILLSSTEKQQEKIQKVEQIPPLQFILSY